MTTAPSQDRLVGTVLGGSYRLDRIVGEGGMGKVYAATHLRLANKRFAVKVLHAGANDNSTAYARFRREAEIATRIGHPHIVEVVDFNVTEEGQPFMVMELLDGEDLHDLLSRTKRLVPDVLIRVIGQVADALQAAHDRGVVHRDLKPENIFLSRTPDGPAQVKLLDFGLSKIRHARSAVTRENQVFGTPYYMSPEQASGEVDQIDHRTDVFALGVIAYRCLTGVFPFDAPTPVGVLYQVCHSELVPPSQVVQGVSRLVDRVVGKALDKERDARYPSVRAFADDLIRALAARPEEDPPSPETIERLKPPERQKEPSGRFGLLVVVTFSAILVAAGVVAALLALPEREVSPERAATPTPLEAADLSPAPSVADTSVDTTAPARDAPATPADAALAPARPAAPRRRPRPRPRVKARPRPKAPRTKTKKPPVRYDDL